MTHAEDAPHRIVRLWTHARAGAPMEEHEHLELVAGQGVRGDGAWGHRRHVTIVFQDDWAEAESELGTSVDPSGRRANVLVSGGGGAGYIGSTIDLGDARLEIQGETRPCPTMENAAVGLHEALKPNCRAGVWGVITTGATVRVGDGMRAV